jgi:amino acid transporter
VLVSAAMIAAGLWHFRSEARMEPVRIRRAGWTGIMAGAVVIVISFAMDYENIMAGGTPRTFNWSVFAAGLAIGIGSYGWAIHQSRRVDQSAIDDDLSLTVPR